MEKEVSTEFRIEQILVKIQSELKAPKNQRNTFGGYNYRNCEDIQEALKPLLLKYECSLFLTDEIVEIGGRIYVKAKAMFLYKDKSIVTYGYAREEESKKGFDQMQLTGATSSYSRKHALNGMFLIDDNKDSDFSNKHEKTTTEKPKPALIKLTNEQIEESINTGVAKKVFDNIGKRYIVTKEQKEKLEKSINNN